MEAGGEGVTKRILTNTPFISLKTTPLKAMGDLGSRGSWCSSRHPSCLQPHPGHTDKARSVRVRIYGE